MVLIGVSMIQWKFTFLYVFWPCGFLLMNCCLRASLVAQNGKESACNARDPGSIPGWGISLEKEMATHSSILAWRTPWTEEHGGLEKSHT